MKATRQVTVAAAHALSAIALWLLTFSAFAQTPTNVALQANGGVASASSTINANYPAAAVNNGDRKGLGWGSGGGWNDAAGGYPDWVQVTFSSTQTINEIDVFTLQDNYSSPAEPTETMTFGSYGITAYDVQYWDGSAWVTVPSGSVSGNNLVWRKFTFSPVSTDRVRVLINASLGTYSRVVEVEAWSGAPPGNQPPSVAIIQPAPGATFTAPATITLNATASDSDGSVTKVEYYAGTTKIGEALTPPYAVAWSNPPTGAYLLTAKAHDDQSAITVSAPVSIAVNDPPGTGVNVALQANGGVASASSTYNAAHPVAAVNNGDRKGLGWGSGGGWNDATAGAYPDWVQVTFSSTRMINKIDVLTLQDNYSSPVEPTETMTFGSYGVTAYDVQYWDGSAWVTVPGGSVTGNNRVWRKFLLTLVSTDRIRVLINASLGGYSRIVEVEAWEAQTYQVSGTATAGVSPLPGVTFAATNGATCTPSDSSGHYDCTVPVGWSGTVTPSLAGNTFTPSSRSYSNVSDSQSNQDFAAGPSNYHVIGTVTAGGSPVPGVTFAATNGGICTPSDASGQYDCTVPASWSGTVTPSLVGYTFTPPSRSYSNVSSNQGSQDFTTTGQTSTSVFFIHTDQLNTPRAVSNSAGQTVWRWDSDPFGDILPNEDPNGLGVFSLNLRFPGQYFDKETNLHYNYFRDYDPAIGRYVQSDPIGLAGGLNTYSYVASNALRWSDSFGLQAAPAPNPAWGSPGAGGGTWWSGRQRPRDPNGFQEDLFPEAGKKPGVKWPEWLRPWITAQEEEAQGGNVCPVPLPSDPSQNPWPGVGEWRGKDPVGGDKGAWVNPETGEQLHPDLRHKPPIPPHWDYQDPGGKRWRVDPATGAMTPT